ncbi:MAG: hypothetical protein EOM20_13620, partial [Spartobacteria bacterium]|nr:hypothetical protein [Spartobacteria bacterium]
MVERRDASMVGGYTALRAAQRAAEKSGKGKKKEAAKDAAKPDAPAGGKPRVASHAGRTVMPTKYEIICYDCGFSFQQAGRAKTTMCPKCKAMLDFIDYTIDREWHETVKTAGTVKITENGMVKSGDITAGNIVMAGRIEGGHIKALHQLRLKPGGQFAEAFISCQDFYLEAGMVLKLKDHRQFRHVEVAGDLSASFEASGLVAIKATGVIRGD